MERLTEKGGHRTYIHTERLTEEGGTPDIQTYRKTKRRGGDSGHTYIHTERLTEEGGTPDKM